MEDFMDGQWHDWEGGDCPVPGGTMVQAFLREDGGWSGETFPAETWDWSWQPESAEADIVRFRVVKEPQ